MNEKSDISLNSWVVIVFKVSFGFWILVLSSENLLDETQSKEQDAEEQQEKRKWFDAISDQTHQLSKIAEDPHEEHYLNQAKE